MIRVAVCDDAEADRRHLQMLLKGCPLPLEMTEYESGLALLRDPDAKAARFDIYLLDIYLSDVSGLEVARRIRAASERAVILFISTSPEFYREAFDVYALNYLVKPVTQEALDAVMSRAADELARRQDRLLPVTSRGHTYLLRHNEIIYVSSSNHSLCFHLSDGRDLSCYGKLDEAAALLPPDSFVRCHQSFLVNLSHVTEHSQEYFQTIDGMVPISRTYAARAREAMHHYLFGIFDKN